MRITHLALCMSLLGCADEFVGGLIEGETLVDAAGEQDVGPRSAEGNADAGQVGDAAPDLDASRPLVDAAPPLADAAPPRVDATPPLVDAAPPLADAAPLPPDAAPLPEDAGREPDVGQCVEDLCVRCDEDGRPFAPADDPDCPTPDCSAFDDYRIHDDHCHVTPTEWRGDRCAALGRCVERGDADRCVELEEFDVRPENACERVVCGPDRAEVEPLPEGAECGRGRFCDDEGECVEAPDGCDLIDAELCDEGGMHCEVYIEERTSCQAFCARYGVDCREAWSASDEECARGREIGCDNEEPELVCRCRKP